MESQNSIQKLKNNLYEKTLLDDIDKLLTDGTEKLNSHARTFLRSLKRDGKLYLLYFKEDCDYISKYYDLAFQEFQKDKKVAQLSYGLVYIKENVYLYIKKDAEETLKYIQNYRNITPIDINDYAKSNASKNSNQSELMLKGGLNFYGYSFEFNVNYFFKTLSDLIELPDLAIDLSSRYNEAYFKEIDLAFYNLEPALNKNISLLRTTSYFKILKNQISYEESKPFEIYENSLILGEVKSRFPKFVIITSTKTSLEEIINKLFDKLDFFYKLYCKMGLFSAIEIKNIELIFFYDNVQLKNFNKITIQEFIEQNKKNWESLKNIPIHLFIVYTLPAISNNSIYDLRNKIKYLEVKGKQNEIKINELEIKDKLNENKIKDLENKIKNLQDENQKIMSELGKRKSFNGETNLNNNENKENENKVVEKGGIFDFLNIINDENTYNNNEFSVDNFFDFTKNNNIISNNDLFDYNLDNINDNSTTTNFYDFTKFNNDPNYDIKNNNTINTEQIENNNIGNLLFFDENKDNE